MFGAPTHGAVERYAYNLWKTDEAKGQKERTDALWQNSDDDTRAPTNFVRHPEYYWKKAIKELVSPIAQAMADEAGDGIIFKPGLQIHFPFEYWRRQNDHCFATANIDGEAFVVHSLVGGANTRRFNLHLEEDTVEILDYLRETQQQTQELAGWPNINPCKEIPLGTGYTMGVDPAISHKGIMTRYGKKLLAQGKKFYSKKTLGDLASGK